MPNSATYQSESHKPFIDAIKNVCNKYNVLYYDAYTLSGFENFMYDNGKDTTHPSQDFHKEYLAPQIAQFIKDNYTK